MISILSLLSVLILVMHWIDLYWNVLPNHHPDTIIFNWSDLTIFLAHTGFFMSLFWKKLSNYPAVPNNDPRLKDSIKGNY